jgi:Tol biopolymer transport system component
VYAVAKISPDKSKIAIEIDNGNERDVDYVTHYLVAVFDRKTGEMLFHYDGYNSPEWLPDGRLLMVPNIANDKQGIFIATKDFKELTRIDGGEIQQNLFFLSVNPSGDKLVFTMSGALWMMNIESNHTLSNLQELFSDSTYIQTPIWSPDGNYIAFVSYGGAGRSIWTAGRSAQMITFWNINSKKSYIFNITTAFPSWQQINKWLGPGTYMSWVK